MQRPPSSEGETLGDHLGLGSLLPGAEEGSPDAPGMALFGHAGLCSGYPLERLPERFFVAQDFKPGRDDFVRALAEALEPFQVAPLESDEILWAGPLLCKLAALIQGTRFGVYRLTGRGNPNVHLELGISIGAQRPFVLVLDQGSEPAPLIQGLDHFPMSSFRELRHGLGGRLRPFLVRSYGLDGSLVDGCAPRTALIVSGDLEDIDSGVVLARDLARHSLTPVFLRDRTGKLSDFLQREDLPHELLGGVVAPLLQEVARAVKEASVCLIRIDENASRDAFVVLGMAVALARRVILFHRSTASVPADLRGITALPFSSFTDLEQQISRWTDAALAAPG